MPPRRPVDTRAQLPLFKRVSRGGTYSDLVLTQRLPLAPRVETKRKETR